MNDLNAIGVTEKPLESIQRLMAAFETMTEPFHLHGKQTEASFRQRNGELVVFIVLAGRVDIWREVDNRLVETAFAPSILGLQGSLYRSQHYYLKIPAGSEVRTIAQKTALTIISEQALWHDLLINQGYLNDKQLHHESMLINSSTYEVVCMFLKELTHYPDDERAKISVADYILKRSNLARSGIMKVLSDLRFGGYIEIKHGKLVQILGQLPRNY